MEKRIKTLRSVSNSLYKKKGIGREGRAICRCKGMNDRIGVNGGNLDVQDARETNARGFTRLCLREDNGARERLRDPFERQRC